jgi:hypothetical protein
MTSGFCSSTANSTARCKPKFEVSRLNAIIQYNTNSPSVRTAAELQARMREVGTIICRFRGKAVGWISGIMESHRGIDRTTNLMRTLMAPQRTQA